MQHQNNVERQKKLKTILLFYKPTPWAIKNMPLYSGL